MGNRSEGKAKGLLVPVACAVRGLGSGDETEFNGADVDRGSEVKAFSDDGLWKGNPVFWGIIIDCLNGLKPVACGCSGAGCANGACPNPVC